MDLNLATFSFSTIAAAVGGWNAYRNAVTGKIIAELQLNIRREFNGRYLTQEASALIKEAGEIEHENLKDRVNRLEGDR